MIGCTWKGHGTSRREGGGQSWQRRAWPGEAEEQRSSAPGTRVDSSACIRAAPVGVSGFEDTSATSREIASGDKLLMACLLRTSCLLNL